MAASELFDALPSHWEVLPLGDVCSKGGGNVQTGPFGSQLHASDYVPVGIPFVMPQNIGDNRILTDGVARITPTDADRLSRYSLQKGDIVYSRRGDVKRRALVRDREDGWMCGSGCLRVRFGDGLVDPLYASYYLGHPSVQDWIARHAVGATMPNLNTAILSALPFVVPPMNEQKKIAHILGTLDDKIELNQQINQTMEDLARSLFKSWFIDFDPVRAKLDDRQPAGMDAETAALFPNSFEDSLLGKIPKGWKVSKIEDVADRIAMGPFGSRIKSENFVPSGIPVIRGNNLKNGFIDNDFVFLTEDKANELKSSVVTSGDIVFTHRGTLGQVGLIPKSSRHPLYVVSQSQMLLSVNSDIVSPNLIYCFFNSSIGQHALLANTNTTGVPSISRPSTALKAILFVLPPLSISNKFDEIYSSFANKNELNIQENNSLIHLRSLLLLRLLSGVTEVLKL